MEWRRDGWQNAITGLGTARDKLTAHTPIVSFQLPDQTLEALHSDDDICAKIVEKLPSDALRNSFTITLDAAQSDDAVTVGKQIDRALAQLHADEALREAWIWGRLYGFGAIYVGADDGLDPREPLNIERVKTLSHLTVLRRSQLQRDTYYEDIRAPNFGQPKTYRIINYATPQGVSAQRVWSGETIVHESRLLKFRGVLTSRWGARSSMDWDDSVLQRVFQSVQASSSTWMAAAHLMTDASQGVLKLQNLMQLMTAAGEQRLQQRVRLFDIGRSVARAYLLDQNESFERVPTPFTGIPELLDRFMMRVAAAADMPLTILFGRSPAGLNATGESDTRAWYDQVATVRSHQLTPPIEQLVKLIMATDSGPTRGKILDGFQVVYPALWQPTAKERAETLNITADALGKLATSKIVLVEEAGLHLAHSGDFDELDVAAREAGKAYALRTLGAPPTDIPPDDTGIEPDDTPPPGYDA